MYDNCKTRSPVLPRVHKEEHLPWPCRSPSCTPNTSWVWKGMLVNSTVQPAVSGTSTRQAAETREQRRPKSTSWGPSSQYSAEELTGVLRVANSTQRAGLCAQVQVNSGERAGVDIGIARS